MESLTVLLLNAGRRVELIRHLRAAFDELGIAGRIVTTDINPLNPAWYLGDARYLLPRSEDSEAHFLDCLLQVCAQEHVQLILPLIDIDLPVMARHRAALAERGFRTLVSGIKTIETSNDKQRTYEFVREHGWDAPEIIDLDSARRRPLPLFIKPRFGSGAAHSHKIGSLEELEFYARSVPDGLIQEFISGFEFTTDVFSNWEGQPLVAVPRRRLKVKSGEVSIGRVERDPELEKLCKDIAEALCSIGPMNIQVIRSNGRYYVTDVNARFGGGVPLSIKAGAPMLRWVVQMGLGQPISSENLVLDDGLTMMRFDDSIFFKPVELEEC